MSSRAPTERPWEPPRDLFRRVADLERRVTRLETMVRGADHPTWTMSDGSPPAPYSPGVPWMAQHKYQVIHASISLRDAPVAGPAKGSFWLGGVLLKQVVVVAGTVATRVTLAGNPDPIRYEIPQGTMVTVTKDEWPDGAETAWVFQLVLDRLT